MDNFENVRIPWPGWKAIKELGEGGYGKVYEIERTQHGITERDALKIIRIPKNRQQYDELAYRMTSEDNESIDLVFSEQKDKVIDEIRAMQMLKASDNIVSIKDWSVEKLDDGYSWEIFIRMDVLTPLIRHIKGRKLEDEEVIRLGEDICKALIQCEEENIVHRDIKPDNIMVSPSDKFMLTDFGIARYLVDETTMTGIGSKPYMAPEVANYQKSNKTVDLYSLGLVLYELLNNNRPPFVNTVGKYSALDKEAAIQRRIKGEELPEPACGSDELKRIVLKAASPDPSMRYQTAQEMLSDLENIKNRPHEEAKTAEVAGEEAEAVITEEETTPALEVETETVVETAPADEGAETVTIEEVAADEDTGTVIMDDAAAETAVTETIEEPGDDSETVVIDDSATERAAVDAFAGKNEKVYKATAAPGKRRNIKMIVAICVAIIVAGIVAITNLMPQYNPKAVKSYNDFAEVANEKGWNSEKLYGGFGDPYAYEVFDKPVNGEANDTLKILAYFYSSKKEYNSDLEFKKEVYNATEIDPNTFIMTDYFEDGDVLTIVVFKDNMCLDAEVQTPEGLKEVYDLLEATGIEVPDAVSGHWLEEQETIAGWNCTVYELDEPITNAKWVDISVTVEESDKDAKGSYKLMYKTGGKWDKSWSVDIEGSDEAYAGRFTPDSGDSIEALVVVPDSADPGSYSGSYKIMAVKSK
ncbi:MAG: serine/threonine protein kinase [Mogibacterium sp.]|nr:serine/threonine protein kinase [Mogibacterium sp.]